MARDLSAVGTTSRHARTEDGLITNYLSSWNVTETAASTAVVKLRDACTPPAVTAIADGASGSVDSGVHYATVTLVTIYGESVIGG